MLMMITTLFMNSLKIDINSTNDIPLMLRSSKNDSGCVDKLLHDEDLIYELLIESVNSVNGMTVNNDLTRTL